MNSPQSRLSLLLVTLVIVLAVPSSYAATSILEGTVVKIADGDAITVLDSDKVQHRVRIAGIDAPEKGQPFGNASGKRLGELVARKEVRVEFDKHDRWGRIVGKVLVRPPDCPTCGMTLDVGLAQVTSGMAWWYRKYANERAAGRVLAKTRRARVMTRDSQVVRAWFLFGWVGGPSSCVRSAFRQFSIAVGDRIE